MPLLYTSQGRHYAYTHVAIQRDDTYKLETLNTRQINYERDTIFNFNSLHI